MQPAAARVEVVVLDSERRHMGQTVRFQETLRRLTMIDEGFVEGQAGLGLGHGRGRSVTAIRCRTGFIVQQIGRGSPTA